jgi:hypothetical protein
LVPRATASGDTLYSDLRMEPTTPYTLWSRGRLLGESELDYVRVQERHRMGDFAPTELGEKLMPIVTGVSRALIDLARTSRTIHEVSADGSPAGFSEGYEGMQHTTEYADAAAAQTHFEGLELELRAPDGGMVPTEWIDVRDTEFLQSLIDAGENEWPEIESLFPDEAERKLLADIEHDAEILEEHFAAIEGDTPPVFDPDEDDERVFPRYQIQVGLFDESAIP